MTTTCPKCGSRNILTGGDCGTCGWRPLGRASCSPSGIEADVCADIAARQRVGINKYGRTVVDQPWQLKAWMQHAYEECLDQAIYLKRAMREMENKLL
jgi:hypothetical protein